MNAKKTEIISLNHNIPLNIELETAVQRLKKSDINFRYLGAWMKDS